MNLIEKIGLVIAGPYPALVAYYGDLLWFAALWYEQFNSPVIFFLLLSGINVVINLVQLEQQKLISNGMFGELNKETSVLIQDKASRDGIKNVLISLVTSFPVLNAFCEQKIRSCEIIISHHWFEIPEAHEHLESILEHEFAHARGHHRIKAFLFASFLFSLGLVGFLYLTTLNFFPIEQLHILNGIVVFCVFRASTFLQAWYHRRKESEADAMALAHTTPEKLAACLQFMRKHNPGEKIMENIPEWARASHPYIASRVQKLLKK